MRSVFTPRVIIGLFMLALCVPGIAVMFSPQFAPAIKSIIKHPGEWANLRDGIRRTTPLWNNAVEGYSSFLYALGTTNDKAIAVVGRDGWIFLGDFFNKNMSQALGRRHYNDAELNAWSGTVGGQEQWLARRDIPMLFVVAPAKWSVYPDKLPQWSEGRIGTHIFDQLLSSPQHLPLIDLRPSLQQARSIGDTYSPFNSHWTDFGAWVGWKEISNRLATLDPKFKDLYVPSADGAVVNPNYGSEFKAMISLPEPNPWTMPKLASPLPEFAIVGDDGSSQIVPGSTHTGLLDLPRNTRNESAKKHLRALVLRDSMGDSLSPYLQAAFYETIQVRHNIDNQSLAPNVPALIEKYKPDVVLYVMTERHLDNILSESYLWLSANNYDLAVSQGARVNVANESPVLTTSGNSDLKGSFALTWADSSKGLRTVRVSLKASAPGTLKIQGVKDGRPVEFAERYAQGDNELFLSLTSEVEGAQVSFENMDPSVQVTLGKVSMVVQDAK